MQLLVVRIFKKSCVGFDEIDDEVAEDSVEGMTQKRQSGNTLNDKYRITLVNYFKQNVDPIGVQWLSILILIGQYARLSNIDDNHLFIKDEMFVVGETETFREAGTYTSLMFKWVELRKKARLENDDRTLSYFAQFLDIMQQPSGFEDAIISKWIIQAEGGQM